MKKLLFSLCVICSLSLFVFSTGYAYNNEIGFYIDLDRTASQIDMTEVGVFDIYVFIHNPHNTLDDVPVENLGGFDFLVTIPTNNFLLSALFPPVPTLNLGSLPGEYFVYFGEPVPVVPETPTLILTMSILSVNPEPDQFFYLSPLSYAAIPGEISIFNFEAEAIIPINNIVGGLLSNPIFAINPTEPVVAVDGISLDGIKALYR
jgi:hypothetical protein